MCHYGLVNNHLVIVSQKMTFCIVNITDILTNLFLYPKILSYIQKYTLKVNQR
jgi:hypothetical protein